MLNIPQFDVKPSDWIENNQLSGKKLAGLIRNQLAVKIKDAGIRPGLAVMLVGDDPASDIYVSGKEKAATEVGFKSIVKRMPATSQQEELLAVIHKWNHDPEIHGILVQLPLPKHLNEKNIIQAVIPDKDVDGFHLINAGRLATGNEGIIPCTPLGIAVMLKLLNLDLSGKRAVILGRSNLVGKPMAFLLMDYFQCTVTICHSRTSDIESHVRSADILVSAMGVREIVKSQWVKKGAIVVDVGMHRIDKTVTGDMDWKEIAPSASYITPVPGGVGPMTIAMLLSNTYHNAVKAHKIELV